MAEAEDHLLHWSADEPERAGSRHPGQPHPPPTPRFARWPTVLSAVFLVICWGTLVAVTALTSRLDQVESPERALALIVSREMDFQEALQRAPRWERALYELTAGVAREEAIAQAIRWYEELTSRTTDSIAHVHVAILEGSRGRLDRVREMTDEWARRDLEPLRSLSRLLRAVYLAAGEVPDPAVIDVSMALPHTLSSGWWHDQLVAGVARAPGDGAPRRSQQRSLVERARRLLQWNRVGLALDLSALVAGCAAYLIMLLRRTPWRVGTAPMPPRWRGPVGVTVLIRGGAIGTGLAIPLIVVGALIRMGQAWFAFLLYAVLHAPLLILIRRHLLRPSGLTVRQGFGLRIERLACRRAVLGTLAGVGIGALGEWGIDSIAVWRDVPSHWTEWFQGDLAWGGPVDVIGSLLAIVVLGPVLEELVFRGLVFGTLRTRFGWMAAAPISAGVFAAAHGYGLLGWISTFWSGLVWAWLYEKTCSLLPGTIAHATGNLLACFGVLLLRVP